MFKSIFIVVFFSFICGLSQAQLLDNKRINYSKKDSLRGSLSEVRSNFDVTYYHLDVKVDPEEKTLEGSNEIVFLAIEEIKKIQIDLFEDLEIRKITHQGKELQFQREFDAIFIDFPNPLANGESHSIKVFYGGTPRAAKFPPWDGGLIWRKDRNGEPWVGVACQGLGASVWWPNKDHLSDEPDSMLISITYPEGLKNISNGQFRGIEKVKKGWEKSHWFVSNPINNYNVTLNIAKYVKFSERFEGEVSFPMDYYVLHYNLDKAKKHFEQVMPMMVCFEEMFGPYPFYEDGYKLIETTYLGMEHQSAVAYGNKYKTGYMGRDFSGVGLKFDYLIIHETGHEWWGNNISVKDVADLWVHEGFCSYSDALYVECHYGEKDYLGYINYQKTKVANKKPIQGDFGVNNEGSSDMYAKGALMLHTLRSAVGDDEKFMPIFKSINKDFFHKTVSGEDVIDYFSSKLAMDVKPIFYQYIKYAEIPVLQYKVVSQGELELIMVRWQASADKFNLPIEVTNEKNGAWTKITPTQEWQQIDLPLKSQKDALLIRAEKYYVNVEQIK
jgi:aminopeptidase N